LPVSDLAHEFARLQTINGSKNSYGGEMNMLNKQTITLAIAAFLWIAQTESGLAKRAPATGSGEYNKRGIELAEQKHYDAAVAEFTKAIEANPKDPRGYLNRGTAYRQGAQVAEAAEDGAGAATRYTAAVTDFSKEIQLAPKDVSGYLERGQTELMQKQFDAALADLEKAVQLKPDEAVSYKLRGFAEIGLAQWDRAAKDFTTAIEKNSNDPQNYDRRAWANRNLKNYDAAIADYTALIEKDPADAEHLVKRGATYTAMTQYEKAVADYQAALKLNPQDNNTFQRLQYVQGMLAAKNAPPPTVTPLPTPEKPGLITPLNIGIAIAVLIVIAVIVRLVTRGKTEETSGRIR
jgi:tetratricopeptide (TPR) repeat protein